MFSLTREAIDVLRRPDPLDGQFYYGVMVLLLPVMVVLDVLALPVVLLGMAVRRAVGRRDG